jgi:hypothetical protein
MKGCPKSLGHVSYIDAKRRYDCRKCFIAAAVLTVLRHRDFSHLVPLGVFVALIALAESLP